MLALIGRLLFLSHKNRLFAIGLRNGYMAKANRYTESQLIYYTEYGLVSLRGRLTTLPY